MSALNAPTLARALLSEPRAVVSALARPRFLILMLAVLGLGTLAYQTRSDYRLELGSSYTTPYLERFGPIVDDPELGYRSASPISQITLPGLGAAPSRLTLTLGAPRALGTQPVRVLANGQLLGEMVVPVGRTTYSFPLAPEQYAFGDLVVQVLPGQPVDPDWFQQRVRVYTVEIAVADGATGPWKPSLTHLWLLALATTGLYVLGCRLGLGRHWATAAALGGLGLEAGLTAWQRPFMGVFAERIAVLVAITYALLVLNDRLVRPLLARAGAAPSPRQWAALQMIVAGGLLIKAGGAIFPYTAIVDEPWHMNMFGTILGGRFWDLYLPSSLLNDLPGHWQVPASLPYSPFYYILALPTYFWPFVPSVSVAFWNAVLDGLKALMVYYLAAVIVRDGRAGVLAALFYTAMPATFMLLSWGNYPTTFSHWLALLFVVLLYGLRHRLRRPAVFAGLTLLLAIVFISYTVTAAFMAVFVGTLIAGQLWQRRGAEAATLALCGAAAGVLALLGYYGQYLPPLLTSTLPIFTGELSAGRGLGAPIKPMGQYLLDYLPRLAGYGVLVPLLASPLARAEIAKGDDDRWWTRIMAGFAAVFIVFVAAGHWIDMVDKQVWFVIPLVCALGGIAGARLWRRSRAGRIAVGAYAILLGASGLAMWVTRIVQTGH